MRDEFVGDSSIILPVTFDYRGGRSGNLKSSLLLLLVTLVVVVLASLVIFNMDSKEMYIRVLYFIGLLVLWVLFLRFFVFKEKMYKKYIESVLAVSSSALNAGEEDKTAAQYWGIFDISETYPYECYYVDGKRSIFVALSKDIFIGKGNGVISRHYDAVADAYNVASRNQVDLISIDYMDTVGNDTRIGGLYSDLANSRNEKLKSFVGSLYKGLIDNMEGEFASYDVYCIVTSNKNVELDKVLMRIVAELLEGNYVAYKVLNESAIRQLGAVLTNNEDFSLLEARDRVLRVNNYRSFKPMFVVDSNNNLRMIGDDGEFEEETSEGQVYSEENTGKVDEGAVSEDEEFDLF